MSYGKVEAMKKNRLAEKPSARSCIRRVPPAVASRDPGVATHLYRIAQESVTNACKHGRAKHVRVTLSSTAEKLKLSVSDDGRGLTKSNRPRTGMGMRIMNYRAESLGGSLVIRHKPGGGTTVVCEVPLPADRAPEEQ